MSKVIALLGAALITTGCAAQPVLWTDGPIKTLTGSAELPGAFLPRVTGQDRTIVSVIEETYSVLRSAEFTEHVSRVRALAIEQDGAEWTGAAVAQRYLQNMLPSSFVVRSRPREIGHTDWNNGRPIITLGHVVVERGRSSALQVRACAINTIAHELAHTVSDNGRQLFLDDGHKGKPLASYTLGAVAQCTFLLQHGVIDASAMHRCIDAAGTTALNASTCDEDWKPAMPLRAESR